MFLSLTGGFAQRTAGISREGAAIGFDCVMQVGGRLTDEALIDMDTLDMDERSFPTLVGEVGFARGPAARGPVLEPTPAPERPLGTVVRQQADSWACRDYGSRRTGLFKSSHVNLAGRSACPSTGDISMTACPNKCSSMEGILQWL